MMNYLKKNLLYLLALSLVFPVASCDSDDDNNDDNLVIGDYRLKEVHLKENGSTDTEEQVKLFYDQEGRVDEVVGSSDGFTEEFSYNAAGKPTEYRYIDGDFPEDSYTITLTWDGNTATAIDSDDEEERMKFIIDSKGQVQKMEVYYIVLQQEVMVGYIEFKWKDNNLESMTQYSLGEFLKSARMINPDGSLNFKYPKLPENTASLLLKAGSEVQKNYEVRYKYDDKINPLRVYPLAQFQQPNLFSRNNTLQETEFEYDNGEEFDAGITDYTLTYNDDGYPDTKLENYTDGDYSHTEDYMEVYIYEKVK